MTGSHAASTQDLTPQKDWSRASLPGQSLALTQHGSWHPAHESEPPLVEGGPRAA